MGSEDIKRLYDPCRIEYFTGNFCVSSCDTDQYNSEKTCVQIIAPSDI